MIALVIVGVVTVLLLVVVFAPLTLLLPYIQLPSSIQLVALQGSVMGGSAMVDVMVDEMPLPTNLSWQWCPGFSLARWCTELNQYGLELTGTAALSASTIKLTDVDAEITQDYVIPRVPSVLFDAAGKVRLDEIMINATDCSKGRIASIVGDIEVQQAQVMGVDVGSVNITARTEADTTSIIAMGKAIGGSVVLQGNNYQASALLSPPAQLQNTMSMLLGAVPAQQGQWQFTQNGVLPC